MTIGDKSTRWVIDAAYAATGAAGAVGGATLGGSSGACEALSTASAPVSGVEPLRRRRRH
ncbi:hypothetical protein R1CP_34015 [Rhodococcus opacus]|uniref:Uncharacterized protein n=1 Tax=Rhodococcus opacus TaxID=37919 RepID=A0A1B1KFQ6_RHOOP|nr:hypothetical protein [Rhodococcus opacus]ANS31418.1 hypothetical protein R1CP_34015 [Rhodococcus opacus]